MHEFWGSVQSFVEITKQIYMVNTLQLLFRIQMPNQHIIEAYKNYLKRLNFVKGVFSEVVQEEKENTDMHNNEILHNYTRLFFSSHDNYSSEAVKP